MFDRWRIALLVSRPPLNQFNNSRRTPNWQKMHATAESARRRSTSTQRPSQPIFQRPDKIIQHCPFARGHDDIRRHARSQMFTHLIWNILGDDLSKTIGLLRSFIDQPISGDGFNVAHDQRQYILLPEPKQNRADCASARRTLWPERDRSETVLAFVARAGLHEP